MRRLQTIEDYIKRLETVESKLAHLEVLVMSPKLAIEKVDAAIMQGRLAPSLRGWGVSLAIRDIEAFNQFVRG